MEVSFEMEYLSHDRLVLQKDKAMVAMQPLNIGKEMESGTLSAGSDIDQAAFDQLLYWLNPDPEAAGCEYEAIRRKLIRVFRSKGCAFPEDLADETFNRVARKVAQIKLYYSGSRVGYFYGVAKRIYLEHLRRNSAAQHPLPVPSVKVDLEESLQQLEYALSKLEPSDRALIINYYLGEGRGKIDHRTILARQMGLQLNALRQRVYRIRSRLRAYIKTEKRVASISQGYSNRVMKSSGG
jgi:DNA-directed RNA polymerase specialized sigma24 family protein